MKTLIVLFIAWLGINGYSFLIKPNDYRDAYCGNYACKEIYKHLNSDNQIVRDTVNYTLNVSKSTTDSILIMAAQEGEFNVKLLSSNFRGLTSRCFGKFSGDSIYLTFIPSLGPTSYKYLGKK